MKIEYIHKYVDGKGEEQSYSNTQEIIFKDNYLEYIKSVCDERDEREEWFSIIDKKSIVDLKKEEHINTTNHVNCKELYTMICYSISIEYIKHNIPVCKEIVFNPEDKDKCDELYKQLKDWIR